jgi:hypothetical protein
MGGGIKSSQALAVWMDGGTTYIAGEAVNASTLQDDAVLWTVTNVPEPGAGALLIAGALSLGWRRRRGCVGS